MSVELPEAQILAEQMSKELLQKQIKSFQLQDYQKLQRIGFINKDIKTFDQLTNRKVESIISRGNVIRVKLNLCLNLILAPEYGGRILYHTSRSTVPDRFHLKLSKQLIEKKVNIKSSLVGKDAVVVGLSNSAFQDILFRAKIRPKRKASELSEDERHSLYDAIKMMVKERIRLGGKDQFLDLYGNQGRYTPAMGPNMNGKTCVVCGSSIEKLSLGGGQVYFCPKCQK
jgi:formamidopyrimidine-DNA glycosylase